MFLLLVTQLRVVGSQLSVVGLEVQHTRDAGEVEAGTEQLTDPAQASEILLAVAAGAPLGPVRLEEPPPFVQTQRLHPHTDQLGRD